MKKALGFIGCGKMAYALLKGITNMPEAQYASIYVSDIDIKRTELFASEFGCITGDNAETVSAADVIFLAVKPGQVKSVLEATCDCWDNQKLLISIAAGISTRLIENTLGMEIPVIRVMPNTPCLVAEGVAAISGGKYALPAHLDMVQQMLDNLGMAFVIDENYMDAVTAVSGSGPGYAYLVVEAMMDAAVQVGLNSELARQLVVNTIKGSMTMLQQTGEHPAVLKAQVCSPGGTTIAGIRELEGKGIRKAFFAAIEKAYQRSIEQDKS